MAELLLMLTAAVLHELGHVLCAVLLNIPLSGLSLRPCGAVMTFDFSKTTYFRELCVHLAGGFFGILSAVLALSAFGSAAVTFAGMSVCLTVMNLLPIEGFDGGGALYCLLAMMFPRYPDRVYAVCRAVSVVSVVLLWTLVLWVELRVRAGAALLMFVLYVMIFHTKIVNFQ